MSVHPSADPALSCAFEFLHFRAWCTQHRTRKLQLTALIVLQEDGDLPGVPALARHLPEHFPPLAQQHEDEDGSSGQASREEQPDSSSSAEAATSSDADPDSNGADGRLEEENSLVNPQQPSEEDTGEENGDAASSEAGSSRLNEGAHAMDDMGSPHVEEYSNGGESAELPDEARDNPGITSEDLWGSDGDSEGGGGDNAAQQLHTSAARGKLFLGRHAFVLFTAPALK